LARKKKKLHFVYAVPYAKKIKSLPLKTPLYRRHWQFIFKWRTPIPAPFCITYNVLNALSKNFEIFLYDVHEKLEIDLNPTDTFLGHFWPDTSTKEKGNNNWSAFDLDQITNRTILKYPFHDGVFAMSPFNHSTDQVGWAKPLFDKLNCYIPICGDHWMDNLMHSEFHYLKGKAIHLNMGIDRRSYPQVKFSFNKKGHRKFLYIGRISKEKNIEMLERIAQQSKNFEGGYIGDGVINGWKQIAPKANLNPSFMKKLAGEYDFFINTSTYDAQATTVLEAMSWGFVVACTPETGYTENGIFRLSANDVEFNLEQVNQLNSLDENDLKNIVQQYHVLLQQKFSWDLFTNRLLSILNKKFIPV
jgi:glycosyltransferase involved in cell wall biosynthesis